MKHQYWVRGAALVASLLAVGWLLEVSHFGALLDQAWIDTSVRGKGLNGELLFVAAAGLATALGMPRQIISFLGGYAFGVVAGTALAVAATLAGCVAAFSYSRWLARDFFVHRFRQRVQRMDDFVSHNPLAMTLLIRLLPVGNNLATNLVAGVSGVRIAPFLVGSALGYIPQTLVFALIGSGVRVDPLPRIGLGIALFVAAGALGIWLYHKERHGRSLGARLDGSAGADKAAVPSEQP